MGRAPAVRGGRQRTPRLCDRSRHPASVIIARSGEDMSAKTILLVDDSATVRNQLRLALEKDGFGVLEAENGERGVAAASEAKVDLIIVDINMPVMDGVEMIRQVRSLERHRLTPIFVLTTEFSEHTVKQGKAAGATAWIVKPVKPEILIKSIRSLLG
jgi:two-component system chemotaxis response regulator CheY